jgi:hypothetical protein
MSTLHPRTLLSKEAEKETTKGSSLQIESLRVMRALCEDELINVPAGSRDSVALVLAQNTLNAQLQGYLEIGKEEEVAVPPSLPASPAVLPIQQAHQSAQTRNQRPKGVAHVTTLQSQGSQPAQAKLNRFDGFNLRPSTPQIESVSATTLMRQASATPAFPSPVSEWAVTAAGLGTFHETLLPPSASTAFGFPVANDDDGGFLNDLVRQRPTHYHPASTLTAAVQDDVWAPAPAPGSSFAPDILTRLERSK